MVPSIASGSLASTVRASASRSRDRPRSSSTYCSARSFIDQDALVMDLLAEKRRRLLQANQIDGQKGGRLLSEVERDLQRIVSVHARGFDREIDVRALEVVAARPRAEQLYPLHGGVKRQPAGQILDQATAWKIVGQPCGRRDHSTASVRSIPAAGIGDFACRSASGGSPGDRARRSTPQFGRGPSGPYSSAARSHLAAFAAAS
jgi:hypothetical protein